jgi:hypothetical protein
VGLIKDRVAALKKLKEEVSVQSLIYAKFESEEQPKLKGLPVFEKGLQYYAGLNMQPINELDREIARTEKEVDGISALVEEQLNQYLSLFSMTTHT